MSRPRLSIILQRVADLQDHKETFRADLSTGASQGGSTLWRRPPRAHPAAHPSGDLPALPATLHMHGHAGHPVRDVLVGTTFSGRRNASLERLFASHIDTCGCRTKSKSCPRGPREQSAPRRATRLRTSVARHAATAVPGCRNRSRNHDQLAIVHTGYATPRLESLHSGPVGPCPPGHFQVAPPLCLPRPDPNAQPRGV